MNWFSVGGQVAPYAKLDANVRGQLERVLPERATGTSLYREHQFGGALLSLGAVDDLGRWVHLRSGRLPRVCRPEHCEVLVIRRGGPITNVPGLRLVPVGEGDLRTATLFGDAIPSQDLGESAFVEKIRRYHRPAPPPLVLANGVAALDRSPRPARRLPQLRLGGAAAARHGALVVGRGSGDADRAGAHCLPGIELRLRADRAHGRAARRGRLGAPRRSTPAAARR